jgi:hypothetical protein
MSLFRMNINCENNVKKVLTIQIVDVYLYQANELTIPLLTSKPLGVTMTNQYTKGDRNDKANEAS